MTSDARGPIENRQWPSELSARAVLDDNNGRRLFGYDLESDLAVNYSLSDVLLLAITGEIPDEPRLRAFQVALCFATGMPVAEAPVHAAVVGRLCGVRTGGVLAIGAIALGEHVDTLLAAIGGALETECPVELPPSLRARDTADRAAVERLRAALEDFDVPVLRMDPSRDVAVVAVLRACGVETSFQIGAALVLARLTSVVAESGATRPGSFKEYPIDTPHFEYDGALPARSGQP